MNYIIYLYIFLITAHIKNKHIHTQKQCWRLCDMKAESMKDYFHPMYENIYIVQENKLYVWDVPRDRKILSLDQKHLGHRS